MMKVMYGCFPDVSHETQVLKMVSPDTGAIRLFLLTIQHRRGAEGEEENIFRLELAPPSRYLDSTPAAYNRPIQIQHFKRGGGSSLLAEEREGS